MAGQNMLQRLNAAKGRTPVGAAGGRFNPLSALFGGGGGLTTGLLLGEFVTAPMAVGLGNYLRSPQGVLAKDRLRQGDIGGAFSAVTGLGRTNAPRLEQYNPPGFDPSQPVTIADLRKTLQETGPLVSAPAAPPAPVDPLSRLSPQDRAYQQERARVEAMVKSNPDMQKEEIAAARAKVRDQGMEAWAKENSTLAKTVMPGQSGFSAIQGVVGRMPAPSYNPLMARTFGYQTGGAPDQQRGASTTGPTTAVLQASPELNPASPTFVGGEGAPILRDLTPELLEQYQEQLLKQAK